MGQFLFTALDKRKKPTRMMFPIFFRGKIYIVDPFFQSRNSYDTLQRVAFRESSSKYRKAYPWEPKPKKKTKFRHILKMILHRKKKNRRLRFVNFLLVSYLYDVTDWNANKNNKIDEGLISSWYHWIGIRLIKWKGLSCDHFLLPNL